MFDPMRHETDTGTIVGRLQDVADAAVDIVAPPTSFDFHEGTSQLRLDEPLVTPDGVYDQIPVRFNRTALRQQADRFDIPLKYVDTLAAQQPDLLATNFNERAGHCNAPTLYRLLRTDDGWLARATLSNGFQAIDNLDILTATIKGAAAAGVDLGDCLVDADWTHDRFRVRIAIPQIAVHMPDLLADYRSPFRGGDRPWDWTNHTRAYSDRLRAEGRQVGDVVWAGLEIGNGETGGGAATITPRALVLACLNGLTRRVDAVRSVHLGGRLENGPVQWSALTQRKAVELIEAKVSDAVNRFCSEDYLNGLGDEMRAAKGLEVVNPVKAVEVARERLGFSDSEVESALAMFVRSGDTSVLGLGQAVTAMAQTVDDGDRQAEIEDAFWSIVSEPGVYAEVK